MTKEAKHLNYAILSLAFFKGSPITEEGCIQFSGESESVAYMHLYMASGMLILMSYRQPLLISVSFLWSPCHTSKTKNAVVPWLKLSRAGKLLSAPMAKNMD